MKFFLSSTYNELAPIRNIALSFLEDIVGNVHDSTGKVVAMEYFSASEHSCKEECLKELDSCDLVIGIYGKTYGSIDSESGLSMTEVEYDYAVKKRIPILAFVMRTSNREPQEENFIQNKVYARSTCANFIGAEDFAERLNDSLKSYLFDFDGYSYKSLWSEVTELCKKFQEATDDKYDLQMIPYNAGDDAKAIEDILQATSYMRDFLPELNEENDAIHDFAYTAEFYPENLSKEDEEKLALNVTACANTVLKNWETINIGLENHITAIVLATTFLKLRMMQKKLLTEPWTEALRQEVIKTREGYLRTIKKSQYID